MTTSMRCDTKHGAYQCDREKGHKGECETKHGPRSVSSPELRHAKHRVAALEAALREIQTAPCDADGLASCVCCLHDRAIATTALNGIR